MQQRPSKTEIFLNKIRSLRKEVILDVQVLSRAQTTTTRIVYRISSQIDRNERIQLSKANVHEIKSPLKISNFLPLQFKKKLT